MFIEDKVKSLASEFCVSTIPSDEPPLPGFIDQDPVILDPKLYFWI
jgi:hypothetical protein